MKIDKDDLYAKRFCVVAKGYGVIENAISAEIGKYVQSSFDVVVKVVSPPSYKDSRVKIEQEILTIYGVPFEILLREDVKEETPRIIVTAIKTVLETKEVK